MFILQQPQNQHQPLWRHTEADGGGRWRTEVAGQTEPDPRAINVVLFRVFDLKKYLRTYEW